MTSQMAQGASWARGSLAERPFAQLLVHVYQEGVTGKLTLDGPDGGRSTVFLRGGMPVFVARPTLEDSLDRVLREYGVVPSDRLELAEEVRAETGKRLGELLEEMGALDHGTLAEALRLQNQRKLTRLFMPASGVFEVRALDHEFGLGNELDELKVDPPRVLYPGIRAGYDAARLERELAVLAGRRVRLTPAPPLPLANMSFLPSDRPLLAALAGYGVTLDELPVCGTPLLDAQAVLLTLHYAGMLDWAAEEGEAEPALIATIEAGYVVTLEEPALEPPPERDFEAQRGPGRLAADEATAPAAAPLPATAPVPAAAPVPATAPAGDIAAASAAFSRRMTVLPAPEIIAPPRATPTGMAAVATPAPTPRTPTTPLPAASRTTGSVPAVSQPASAAPAASRTTGSMPVVSQPAFTTPTTPNTPLPLSGGIPTPPPGSLKLPPADARFAAKMGETFLARGNFKQAEEAFADAAAKEPGVPEHELLLAWVRFCNPVTREATARDALKIVTRHVNRDPDHARGFYFLGMILKHFEEIDKAEKAFAKALKLDGDLVDALREMRLLTMRRPASKKR